MVKAEASQVFGDLRTGRPRAFSRAISWVENGAPQASALLEQVYAQAPHPWVVGITGVGGAGKSSLVPHLARRLAEDGTRIAVLAVDPSSPLTGGALLGDRIRDANGEQHPRVFFRSVATRGGQGGLATCVADLVRVAAAAGHEIVLIETVGAGQSELGILQVAHTVLLVNAPGLGDDVQAQKAGVMEVADVLAVNKADRPGALDTAASLRQALQLSEREAHMRPGANALPDGAVHWHPPVLATVALTGQGVQELCDTLREHRAVLERQGRLAELNRLHDLRRMQSYFMEVVQQRLQARIASLALADRLEAELAGGQGDPLAAARLLADAVLENQATR
ncbi:methylmalonyl Co-A mutase-associated GTPase MeaB [Ramlibacter sp. G-1-2-2]|uniref:Methylmalonyl Co-A mutase-associated GTPase MeaB n=1 Tax=Ramlibacter agri TaxID=2728837 RepID=A0A848H8C3_9BURK|nr:methylmalonyl Co-A mutase-associated GTPase MeaB [Ramlibacter agri]NML45721.1 methylmalonyl Co-A mutase-associated GTPase MeaB [Ramlibacter agri]